MVDNFDFDFGHAAADGGYLDTEFHPVTPGSLRLVRAGDASACRDLELGLRPYLIDLAAQPVWKQAGIDRDDALRRVIEELRADNYRVVAAWSPSKMTLARHVTRQIERLLSTRHRAIDMNRLRACIARANLRRADRALLLMMEIENQSAKSVLRAASCDDFPRQFNSPGAVRQARRRARQDLAERCHQDDRAFVQRYLSTVRRRG
jgi:hypothetical protein